MYAMPVRTSAVPIRSEAQTAMRTAAITISIYSLVTMHHAYNNHALRYRTMDGVCNHRGQSLFGAAFTPYVRLLSPRYDDGRNNPFSAQDGSSGYEITHSLSLTDSNRPSARELTRFLIAAAAGQSSSNQLLMAWGQFISHDVARSSQLTSDCSNCIFNSFSCANIPVFRNDPRLFPLRD